MSELLKVINNIIESLEADHSSDESSPASIDNKVERRLALFDQYREKILEINKSVNITRIVEKTDFDRRHYIDSLMCCLSDEFNTAERILDLGSGGGFPGVPLAIMFPEKDFVLMDSSAKRMRIVQQITDELGIDNVVCVHGRAEELGRTKEYREQFDLCVSRAVASMSTLSEYCLPFVRLGGSFIAYKGPGSDDEISQGKNAVKILGGHIDRIEEAGDTIFSVPGNEGHRLVYIKKDKSTPPKYPRGGGKPSKKPL